MKALNRKRRHAAAAGAALALTLLVTSPSVLAEKTEPILAHIFAKGHIFNKLSERFTERLEEISQGAFDVRYYPGGTLGGWTDLVEQVVYGQIEMTLAWNHSELDQRWDIAAMGFIAADWESAHAAYGTGSPLLPVYEDIASDLRMELLGVVPIGFRGFIVREGIEVPTNFPEDAKGFKVRVPGWPMAIERYEAVGFSPVTMPFAGLHTALQTGAVDGAAYQPVSQVPAFADVISAYVYTREDFEHGFWLASKEWIKSLSPQQREWVRTAAREVTEWSWQKAEQLEKQWLSQINDLGVEVVRLSPDERQEYRQLVVNAERAYISEIIDSDTLQLIKQARQKAAAE